MAATAVNVVNLTTHPLPLTVTCDPKTGILKIYNPAEQTLYPRYPILSEKGSWTTEYELPYSMGANLPKGYKIQMYVEKKTDPRWKCKNIWYLDGGLVEVGLKFYGKSDDYKGRGKIGETYTLPAGVLLGTAILFQEVNGLYDIVKNIKLVYL